MRENFKRLDESEETIRNLKHNLRVYYFTNGAQLPPELDFIKSESVRSLIEQAVSDPDIVERCSSSLARDLSLGNNAVPPGNVMLVTPEEKIMGSKRMRNQDYYNK